MYAFTSHLIHHNADPSTTLDEQVHLVYGPVSNRRSALQQRDYQHAPAPQPLPAYSVAEAVLAL